MGADAWINTPSQKQGNECVGEVLSGVEIGWAHETMVGGGMMLGVVVAKVLAPGSPVDLELALGGPILEPIESHVDGLGAFLLYCAVGKSDGSGVVNLHWSGWLRMPELLEGVADRDGLLAIDV